VLPTREDWTWRRPVTAEPWVSVAGVAKHLDVAKECARLTGAGKKVIVP